MPCSITCAALVCVSALQIKENEFLQRENLLLEAYLAKIDFSKVGIEFDEDTSKVRQQVKHAVEMRAWWGCGMRLPWSTRKAVSYIMQVACLCCHVQFCLPQKKKSSKKGKIETKQQLFNKLTDDEKNDLVSMEVELVQAEIEQVCTSSVQRPLESYHAVYTKLLHHRNGNLCSVLATQLKKAGDKDIDDIRTLMEEVDLRIAETKKDTYEFKRDIIIGAENPRTGKIVGEKMIR